MNKLERFRRAAGMKPQRHATPDRENPPCQHAEWRMERPCCGDRWMCQNADSDKHQLAVTGKYCVERCNDRVPVGDDTTLKIAAVLTARNEGEQVRKTVDSLLGSVRNADVRVFVVDDASEDGSCDWIEDDGRSVERIRHDKARGVGRSRNAGCRAALAWGADVVSFHDAHMRFPDGGLETLAKRAVDTGNVVCSGCDGLEPSCRTWGCDMYYDAGHALHVKWDVHGEKQWKERVGDDRHWMRSPAMMGAGYVMSADTIERLSQPLGQLWDDVHGKWGFSEQDVSVKAFLLDIPIEFCRDVIIRHHYRTSNPNPISARDTWLNATYALAGILHDDTFDTRFRPLCEKKLTTSRVNELVSQARRNRQGKLPWGKDKERELFTHLLGKRAPITEPHEDHAWWNGDLEGIATDADRVFQWRPGEATLRLAKERPDCHITVVEWCDARLDLYGPVLAGLDNVTLQKVPLADWTNPWGRVDVPADGYDTIIVTGDWHDQCIHAARKYLAYDGQLLKSYSADHNLLHTDARKKAEKALKKAEQKLDTTTPPVSTTTQSLPQKYSFEPVYRRLLKDLQPDRILEWGPGRSTAVAHEACPEAEIRTIENQQSFAEKAKKQHPYADVRYYEIPDYGPSRYASAPYLEDWGEFDVVFVDGRRRNECLLTASRVCASDGVVILHDSQRRHYNLAADLLETQADHGDTLVLRPRLQIQEVAHA